MPPLIAAPMRMMIDAALPPRCPACGTIVASDHSLCGACWSELRFIGPPWCAACHRPFETARGEGALCGACLAQAPRHDGVRAAVAYGDVARDLAMRLKHGGRVGVATLIGRLLARHAADVDDAILVPVPLHRGRIWTRGFNQAAAIARVIGHERGLAVVPDALVRRKRTPMLRGLGAAERRRALAGAIAVRDQAAVTGRAVLLVDDVYTSGATSDACVVALKRAGAARVVVLAWARVLKEGVD